MLLHADEFGTYGIGGEAHLLDGIYAQNTNVTQVADPDPSGAGLPVAKITAAAFTSLPAYSARPQLRKAFPSSKTALVFSFLIWMPGLPVDLYDFPCVGIADVNNTPQFGIRILSTGAIQAMSGGAGSADGGTALGTSTVALVASAWNHVEVKVTGSTTTGAVDIYVNKIHVLALTNKNTAATGIVDYSQMSLQCNSHLNGNGYSYYVKNFIVCDTTGSYNNDIMGPCYVGRFTVDGDNTVPWSKSSGGVGYSLINAAGPNDAGYIYADTSLPAKSKFTIQDLPAGVTAIKGIVLMNRLKKTDSGTSTTRAGLDHGGTVSWGASREITTAFTYWPDVLEVDSFTGLPFTPTDFNNLLYDIDRTA